MCCISELCFIQIFIHVPSCLHLGFLLAVKALRGYETELEKQRELKKLCMGSKSFAETLQHKARHLRKCSLILLSPSFIHILTLL